MGGVDGAWKCCLCVHANLSQGIGRRGWVEIRGKPWAGVFLSSCQSREPGSLVLKEKPKMLREVLNTWMSVRCACQVAGTVGSEPGELVQGQSRHFCILQVPFALGSEDEPDSGPSPA